MSWDQQDADALQDLVDALAYDEHKPHHYNLQDLLQQRLAAGNLHVFTSFTVQATLPEREPDAVHAMRYALQSLRREPPPQYQTVVYDELSRWGVRHQRYPAQPVPLVELTAKWLLDADQ